MMIRLNSKGEAPVKLAIVLVVLIVAAGVVVALKPWDWFNSGGTVRFYSVVYFHLLATDDNEPLQNVMIRFPDPNIGNVELDPAYAPNGAFWTLYAYTENGLVVEVDHGEVIQLVSPRTSTIEFEVGYGLSAWGPKFGFDNINKLYPGEVLEVRQWVEIPAGKADRLTIGDEGPEPYSTYAYLNPVPTKNIDASFFAGLYRLNADNALQKVEEYEHTAENGLTGGWWELTPI